MTHSGIPNYPILAIGGASTCQAVKKAFHDHEVIHVTSLDDAEMELLTQRFDGVVLNSFHFNAPDRELARAMLTNVELGNFPKQDRTLPMLIVAEDAGAGART